VQNWLTEVRQFARSEATYMIFGNKNDMEDKGQRQVNLVDGAKFA
jgi:GTPase SAR1 family protein